MFVVDTNIEWLYLLHINSFGMAVCLLYKRHMLCVFWPGLQMLHAGLTIAILVRSYSLNRRVYLSVSNVSYCRSRFFRTVSRFWLYSLSYLTCPTLIAVVLRKEVDCPSHLFLDLFLIWRRDNARHWKNPCLEFLLLIFFFPWLWLILSADGWCFLSRVTLLVFIRLCLDGSYFLFSFLHSTFIFWGGADLCTVCLKR